MLLKRTKNGLDKVTASIMDVDNSSLFDIFVPKQLRSGKNEIRLRLVNDGLIKGSDVLIDILDQNKEPLYYEISEIANEDKSRSIIVHVTETDLTGKAYLYIYVKLGIDSSYLTLINLEINPELESEQEIKFSEPPEIFYSEKRLATQTFTNQSRQVIKINNNGTLSTISPIIPRQMVESTFTVEKSEVRELKSDNSAGSGSIIQLPQHFDLAKIISVNFPFSSSYKNGSIEVNGINLEVPNDAITTTSFLNQSYSASIINVISTSSIEVYPPFSKLIEYQTSTGTKSKVYDRFVNQSNFTCSYFETLTLSQTNYTQSYAVFDIFNLSPAAGKIDSLDISYKNLSLLGDNYEPLGNFKVNPVNYLIDSASLFFDNEQGIIERPIGVFKNGVSDFQTYWQSSSLTTTTITDSISNGIKFSGNDLIFAPKRQFITVNRNTTEWTLSFDFELQPSQSLAPQLDIFISGSDKIQSDAKSKSVLNPLETNGTYIGSIVERNGKGIFNFVASDNASITPKFALRRGFLSIGNITLAPVNKVGYNANQTRIYAPINLPSGSEVNFKIEYVNPVGKKLSKFSSLLPGVYFRGSSSPNTSTSTTIPSGTVSGSDQLTSSFDDRYHKLGTGLLSSSNQIANDISGSSNTRFNHLESVTSSYAVKTEVTSISSSFSTRISSLEIKSGSYVQTGSYNQDSGSWNIKLADLTGRTGSYATTGSNTFIGGQIITGSMNVSSSVTARDYNGIFNGQPSSSQQIKILLPTSTVSGSEQLTGSYDVRYERKGTGIYSSSQQIGPTGIYSSSGDVPAGVIGTTLGEFSLIYGAGSDQIGPALTIHPSSGIGIFSGNSKQYVKLGNGASDIVEIHAEDVSGQGFDISINANAQTFIIIDTSNQEFGVQYGTDLSNTVKTNIRSIPDVGIIRDHLTASFSNNSLSSSYIRYLNVKEIPSNIVSSSNQIASDISGSFTSLSGSITRRVYSLEQTTGSLNLFTGSISTRVNSIETKTGSYATTGSNTFRGTEIISGSVLVTGSFTNIGRQDQKGQFYLTGSFTTRLQYTWVGTITAGTTPGIVWTNMPNAKSTWLHQTGGTLTDDATYIADLTELNESRFFTAITNLSGGANATSSLIIDYSTDNVSWFTFTSLTFGNTPGIKDTGWTRLPSGSFGFVYLRLAGQGGDGGADPRFSPPQLLLR